MEKIIVDGGIPLYGKVEISGMKNAAVAVVFASVLANDVCVIDNLPNISDVSDSLSILESIGAKIKVISKGAVEIDTRGVRDAEAPMELVRKMRASYYLAGALLGRFGSAKVGLPGGCDFGVRPIDLHVKAFEKLGATVTVGNGCIEAVANPEQGLRGKNIYFDCCSVGATINAILAAVLAEGSTIIENPAREPHVVDVANFLNACGADIRGAGTNIIKINGVEKLHGCEYSIIPDMIEAGTFMIAAAATGGKLYIDNIIPKHMEAVTEKLREMNITVEEYDEAVCVFCEDKMEAINVKTLPYPGFPTDMHPQMSVLLCLADGASTLSETIWSNRFRYVDELQRMGAKIKVEDKTAFFEGNTVFTPAVVKAVDLRAGAAMVIAALATKGRTEIEDIAYIERGYVDIVEKFRGVGGNIRKVYFPDTKQMNNAS
ncbi:MAG: UDP-N-acetylglucosamine 1-carboxyvinyltransferase [Ruminococcaceae bacterium]|nr:UDP-N-acetylglucosamine 1-carboxyvinyltransferase [Oscillospiraceae bacterium]